MLREFLNDFGLPDFAWRKNKNGFDAPESMWDILELYPDISSVERYFQFERDNIKDIRAKKKDKQKN